MEKNKYPQALFLFSTLAVIVFTLASFFFSFSNTPRAKAQAQVASPFDVTQHVEVLGNPFTTRYTSGGRLFSRNVWDMQLFNNKIYLGSGDSALNTGPVDVWAYDLASGQFVSEAILQNEQINSYEEIDGQLYIPGHDQKAGTTAEYYRKENASWVRYAPFTQTAHIYDIAKIGTELFASGGMYDATAGVWISTDNAATWKLSRFPQNSFRIYSLPLFGEKLFVLVRTNPIIHEYVGNGVFIPRSDLTYGKLFPETFIYSAPRISEYAYFQGKTIYIGEFWNNDHFGLPFGVFRASSIEDVQKILLPANDKAYDLLQKGDALYLLAAEQIPDGTYINRVYKTTDAVQWHELFHFQWGTFARSFEMNNGDFYFGLGTGDERYSYNNSATYNTLSPLAGTIIRIKKGAYTPTPTNTPTPAAKNLLLNPSFEAVSNGDPANWASRTSNSWDNTVAHTGNASMKTVPATDAFSYSFQKPSVQPGKTYTMQGWIKTNNVSGKDTPHLRFSQTAPTVIIFQTTKISGTTDWTKVSKTFTLPTSFTAGRLDVVWPMTAGTAWFDDVVLCEGTQPCL